MPDITQPEGEGERNWWLILTVIIVVACLAAAAFIRFGRDDDGQAAQQDASTSASASATSTGPSATAGQIDEGERRQAPVDDSAMYDEIMADLNAFVTAYYRIEPGDTADSRRARFEQVDLPVAPGLLGELNFEISTDADLDLVEFDGDQSLRASVTNEYQVTDVHGNGMLLNVVAPVEAVQTDRQGTRIGSLYVMTGSIWSWDEDSYVLTGFNDTYQQPGG
jgi:hypothetical protein